MHTLHQFSEGQMFLMDRFFDGTFLTFGIEVISFAERDQEDRIDPMVRKKYMEFSLHVNVFLGLHIPPYDKVHLSQVWN